MTSHKGSHTGKKSSHEDRFSSAFRFAAIGMALVAPDGRWLKVNRALCELVGYSEGELLKMTFQDITHPDDLEVDLAYVQQMLSGELETYQMEKRYFHKQGQIIHVLLSVSLVRDEERQPLYFISQIQDITGHRRADEETRRALKLNSLILESAGEGLFGLDIEGRITFVNPMAAGMLGHSATELIGLPGHAVHHHTKLDGSPYGLESCPIYAAVRDGVTHQESDEIFWRNDGSSFFVDYTSTPMRDEQGHLTGAVIVFRDITARKQAEAALRESEERYRDLVENADDIIYSHDLEGRYTAVNRAVERITGYTPEEALKLSLAETIAPEFIAKVPELMARLLAGEQMVATELEIIAKDGRRVPVEVTTRLATRDGRPAGINGIARDITDRKRAEETLRITERRYRSLFDSNVIGIHIGNSSGLIKEANDRFLDMFGFTRAELEAGKVRWDSMTPPDWKHGDEFIVQETRANGICSSVEKEFRHRDGRRVPVRLTVAILDDNGGDGITLIEDITERKQRERELSRLATAVEQTADSIVITDAEGTIQYVNPAFERITGYSEAEVLGQNPRMLKSGKTDPAVYRDLWETIGNGKVWTGQLTNKRKDGTLFEERVTISPIRDDCGKIVSYIAVKQDITNQIKLEQQLRQSQRLEAIGQLAGGVAHDFNNLLTAILGYSDLTLAKLDANDRIAHNVREIKKAGERAAGLTRQLLAFSRKQILAPRVIDLNLIISDLNKMLRRLIGEDIELTTNCAHDLGTVKADPTQIEQVIMNLVVNARDAMPKGGKLIIETRNVTLDSDYVADHQTVETGEYVLLAVTDTGCGMDAGTQARIFEPFFTTKEVGKGTGLGLSTIYGIVKQSGGYVWVYSELGRGTTFKIYLPRIDEATPSADKRPEPGTIEKGSGTLLLVEDDPSVRGVTARLLEAAGYTVIEADSGRQALDIVEQTTEAIDLVITDVVTPEMSGRELAERLATLIPKTRVLFVSGYTDDAIVRTGIVDKNIAFLEKPFTPQILARKVAEMLGPA